MMEYLEGETLAQRLVRVAGAKAPALQVAKRQFAHRPTLLNS